MIKSWCRFSSQKANLSTDEIVLSYWQNDISFNYVGLHYTNPSKNHYAFKLENYEDEWRYVNESRTATYTNLDQVNIYSKSRDLIMMAYGMKKANL
ncbi:MAG: hypothetical protein H6613_12860 [Ignavibacteriales bacterium]|nr:hypothetical protein [Ignavibacteriales bacterium]